MILGWLIGLACITIVTFITYDMLREGSDGMWEKEAFVTWETLGRTAFGVGIAWMIFACYHGHGGKCNLIDSCRSI